MILPFSQQLNGKATYFPEKILSALFEADILTSSEKKDYVQRLDDWTPDKNSITFIDTSPKLHTIRKDEKGRWKKGNKIHFVINNRQPDQYQFAPVVPVIRTQVIIIKYWLSKKTRRYTLPYVLVDGKNIRGKALDLLAANDGFASREEFFEYFNTDFIGKIIHWTNIKY